MLCLGGGFAKGREAGGFALGRVLVVYTTNTEMLDADRHALSASVYHAALNIKVEEDRQSHNQLLRPPLIPLLFHPSGTRADQPDQLPEQPRYVTVAKTT